MRSQKYNLNHVNAELRKQSAKFLESIQDVSREELTLLACKYYFQCKFYETLNNLRDELEGGLNKRIIGLEGFNKELEKEHSSFAKHAFKNLADHKKAGEYLHNIVHQRNKKIAKIEKELIKSEENKKELVKGRMKANAARKKKGQELQQKLEKAIRDYLAAHSNHKVGNKELVSFLTASFVKPKGSKMEGYSESSFIRQVRLIHARIKRESSGQ